MIKKLLSVFLMLVLALSGIAFNSDDVKADSILNIVDVDIDGTDMSDTNILYVERGDENVGIKVEMLSTEDIDGVRIEASIAGYEYSKINDITEMFDLEEGVKRTFTLRLDIPEDMDANEDYTLRIEAYTQDIETRDSYTLRVKGPRHGLIIDDVLFTPSLNLNGKQPLFVTVRVENMGDNKEEDIKVSVSIPELGIEQATYIDELSAIEDDDDEEDSESSDAIYIAFPQNVQAGTYDLIVKVEYNRGYSIEIETYQLTIDGVSGITEDVLVDITETSKSVNTGEGVVYTISIANMGTDVRAFTADVNGLDWASYRVDPIVTNVQPGSSTEMFVYVSPKEGVEGQRTFTLNVKENGNVVKQFTLEANINEKSEWGSVLTGLEIGFVVLLVILVILGIILAATRMGKKKDEEEPLGETYY